jgi:hypothetical protein
MNSVSIVFAWKANNRRVRFLKLKLGWQMPGRDQDIAEEGRSCSMFSITKKNCRNRKAKFIETLILLTARAYNLSMSRYKIRKWWK